MLSSSKCLLACSVTVLLNLDGTSAQGGNSLYLPPKEPGYDYPKPSGSAPGPSPPQRPSPAKPPSDEVSETVKLELIDRLMETSCSYT